MCELKSRYHKDHQEACIQSNMYKDDMHVMFKLYYVMTVLLRFKEIPVVHVIQIN